MKKSLLALLALVLVIVGCPSGPVDVGVPDASTFAPASTVDAAIDAAPHRLGSFSPWCTGTGIPHVVSGVQTGACAPVSQTADVIGVLPFANGGTNASVGLTTANGVVTSSGTALQQAANVLAGAGYVSIGATPVAAAGVLRLPWQSGSIMAQRNAGNTADFPVIGLTGSAEIFGDSTYGLTTNLYGYNVQILSNGGNVDLLPASGNYALGCSGTQVVVAHPIVGDTRASSPYSVHGDVTDATVGTFALTAASYSYDIIRLTGGTAGTVTFPTPGTNAAYYKTVINTSGVTKTLSDGGATTQPFVTGNTARFLFDTTGVHLAAASTPYP